MTEAQIAVVVRAIYVKLLAAPHLFASDYGVELLANIGGLNRPRIAWTRKANGDIRLDGISQSWANQLFVETHATPNTPPAHTMIRP